MRYLKWINKNCHTLNGHRILIVGATGSIGRYVSEYLAYLNADLILACRNTKLGEEVRDQLLEKYNVKIDVIYLDVSSIESVNKFIKSNVEITDIISLAGVYHLDKMFTKDGYEIHYATNTLGNINLVSNLLNRLNSESKVIVTSSIASNFVKGDCINFDFKNELDKIKIYGATKRILNYSLNYIKHEIFKEVVIAHPGISATSIFGKSHSKLFMKIIFPIMKVLFIKPEKASLSIIYGMFNEVPFGYQIGPKVFSIWGCPKPSKLNKSFQNIYVCEKVYQKVINDFYRSIV